MIRISNFTKNITANSFQTWANTHGVEYTGLLILFDSPTGAPIGDVIVTLKHPQTPDEAMRNIQKSTGDGYRLSHVQLPELFTFTNSVTVKSLPPTLLGIKKILWLSNVEKYGKILARKATCSGSGIITFLNKNDMLKFVSYGKAEVKGIASIYPYFTKYQRRHMITILDIPQDHDIEPIVEKLAHYGPILFVRILPLTSGRVTAFVRFLDIKSLYKYRDDIKEHLLMGQYLVTFPTAPPSDQVVYRDN